jgi:hypothetical protein
MGLLFWPLLGAAIGAYAAQKKGFSTVGGVIGGILLGPLAFLLFFVSGVVSSGEQQRKCPYCAEWVRPEATVCKHCHKEIPAVAAASAPRGSALRRVFVMVAVVVLALVAIFAFIIVGGPAVNTALTPTVTMAEFTSLQEGMTYEQAVRIIGAPGEEVSHSDLVGIKTVMYSWKNGDGSNMNAMFQNGGLVNKAQFGLR